MDEQVIIETLTAEHWDANFFGDHVALRDAVEAAFEAGIQHHKHSLVLQLAEQLGLDPGHPLFADAL
tara:strand:+ start:4872 stop:5072 length:201 start_codon:yes stop_codon:yes gene_type:complete